MRRVLLVLATFTLLAACSSGEPKHPAAEAPSTAPPTPVVAPPPPPAPAKGACYRLSYDDAIAPTSEDHAVPCTKPHTGQTFAVGRLDLVDHGHLLGVDSGAVQAQVSQECPDKLAAYLGATKEQLRLSLLRPVWFTPTVEQSDAGADWYRCDVIAVTGDKQVAKMGHTVFHALSKPAGRAEFGMCGTAQPGTAAFSRVLCREDHSWKAISLVDLAGKAGKKGRWPGEKVVSEAGQATCQAAARAIAADALDYKWGYEWPTKAQWQAGQDYGRCWSPDPA